MRAKRVLSLALVSCLAISLLVVLSAPAGAGTPTCFFYPATIEGTNGNNTLTGTPGFDVIVGMGGNDIIKGMGGNDVLCGSNDADPADGKDTIRGGAGLDMLLGGKADDKLYGDADRDNLFGNAGDDLLNGGASIENVPDEANFAFSPNRVVGNLGKGTAKGEGNDTLVSIESFSGTEFNDRFIGDNKNNAFSGGLGLFTYNGNDTMHGKGGQDTVSYSSAPSGVTVNLEGGTGLGDGIDTFSSMELAIGSSGNDYIVGSSKPNVLFGSDGADQMFGRAGDDIMIGFEGADQMFGGVGIADFVSYSDEPGLAVDINLSDGTAQRSDGNDQLEGVEMVEGSDEDDFLTGDNGPNFFYAEEGNDDIDGKGGSDLIFFLSATGPVEADLGLGTATGMADTFDEIDNVEHMVGGSYADNLTGDDARNFINGSGGVDYVKGVKGDDYLAGGEKNDILEGGDGNRDLVDFFQSKNPVNANLQSGEATGEGNDDLIDVEGLSGGGKDDTLRGNGADNFLYGMNGSDDLFGLGGDDRLDGGKKTDSLSGGPNSDECFTKPEATGCESFKKPGEHPLTEVGRRYKRALASARRYK